MSANLFVRLVFLALIGLSACSPKNESREDVQRSYHSNGKVHKEVVMTGNGTGSFKEYFDNGQLFQEVKFKNNLREGIVKQYYNTGVLYLETPYEKGETHGMQKKYRRSGALMAEIPYYHGKLCMGLKEYTVDGKIKERYPTIVVNTIDNVRKDGTLTIELRMSNGTTDHVDYFLGQLSNGVWLGDDVQQFSNVENGVGRLVYKVKGRANISQEAHFIARVRTYQGNYYLTQATYTLNIQ